MSSLPIRLCLVHKYVSLLFVCLFLLFVLCCVVVVVFLLFFLLFFLNYDYGL